MGRFYTERLTSITIFLYDSEKRYTKEGNTMDGYGLASLLPVAVVIALVLITRCTALSLLAGTVVGAVMLYGAGFAKP